jgi:hypothetical protein
VERKLNKLAKEFRDGRRQGSVISTQTVGSLSNDDTQAWDAIRKELEDIGITVDAFNANKEFIFEWFENAKTIGAFEEEVANDTSGALKITTSVL